MTCCAPVEVVSCRRGEEDSQPEFSTMWWWGTVPGCQVNAISLSEALSPGFLLLPWLQLLGCCTSGSSSSCLWRARLPRTGFLNYFPAFLKIGQLYQLDQRHLNWFWWSWVINISLLRSSDTPGPLRPCRDSDWFHAVDGAFGNVNYIESGAGSLIPFVWVSCMEEGSRKKEVGEGMACASREGGNPLFFSIQGSTCCMFGLFPTHQRGWSPLTVHAVCFFPENRACSLIPHSPPMEKKQCCEISNYLSPALYVL